MSLTPLAIYGANPGTKRAQSTKLGAGPKGAKLIYTQGRCVYIRDLSDPAATLVYAQHAHPTTVARICDTGFYAASADASGSVRVWDLAGDEQMLKTQVQALSGRVNDLAWDGESKRIIAVGEGRERYGSAFLMDTGSSVGEISGHSKPINAVGIRAQRPFKAATGSDDTGVILYAGVPFKYARTITSHTRFVQDVAYALSGASFASAGSDGKIVLYDGTTGDVQAELADGSTAHQGTVFALSYAPDSSRLASCGADGKVKVWDVAERTLLASWDATTSALDSVGAQQMGLVWMPSGGIVSLSFEGSLNVLDTGSAPQQLTLSKKLLGAGKALTSLVYVPAQDALVAGCYDGNVYEWDAAGNASTVGPVSSKRPGILGVGAAADATVYVTSLDDSLRKISARAYASQSKPTSGQARAMAVTSQGSVFVATERGVDVFVDAASAPHHTAAKDLGTADWTPSAIAVTRNAATLAIGDDSVVRLFDVDAKTGSLKLSGVFENARSPVTALAFSPDENALAAGESNGKIVVYDVPSRSVRVFATEPLTMQVKLTQWVFHVSRITSLQWSPDGTHAVSGSLDTHVYVWSVAKPMKNVCYKNAHAGGVVGTVWINDRSIASAGADGCVRKYAFEPRV